MTKRNHRKKCRKQSKNERKNFKEIKKLGKVSDNYFFKENHKLNIKLGKTIGNSKKMRQDRKQQSRPLDQCTNLTKRKQRKQKININHFSADYQRKSI